MIDELADSDCTVYVIRLESGMYAMSPGVFAPTIAQAQVFKQLSAAKAAMVKNWRNYSVNEPYEVLQCALVIDDVVRPMGRLKGLTEDD